MSKQLVNCDGLRRQLDRLDPLLDNVRNGDMRGVQDAIADVFDELKQVLTDVIDGIEDVVAELNDLKQGSSPVGERSAEEASDAQAPSATGESTG